jgi:hypothetical protein
MIAAADYVIKAIAETLEQDVLPQLEPATLLAGNVRSCIMLLTYLEDRVRLEGRTLSENNAAMRALLTEISADESFARYNMQAQVRTVLENIPARPAYVDVTALAAENESYKTVMQSLVTALRAAPDATGPGHAALRARLDNCLLNIGERDYAIVQRAEAKLPV